MWWTGGAYGAMPGRLSILLTRTWFKEGDPLIAPYCYISWAIAQPAEAPNGGSLAFLTGTSAHNVLIPVQASMAYNAVEATVGSVNYIGTSIANSTIDTSTTTWELADGSFSNMKSTKIYRITSIFDTGKVVNGSR